MDIIKRAIFIICLFLFFHYISNRGHKANMELNKSNNMLKFREIIENKIHYRGYYVQIKNKNNKLITTGPLTSELFINCEKGDSIIKNSKGNKCVLKRDNDQIIFECYIQAE